MSTLIPGQRGAALRNTGEIHILLIEDNPEEAELIQSLLQNVRRFEFKLTHVDTLAQGIECLLTVSPHESVDVVLLDLHLPDSSGFSTFDRLNEQVDWAPVILMTNLDNEELALQAVRRGAQDFLLKPELSGTLLSRAIRYAIERKRTEEKLLYDACHDPLTGLANRSFLMERIKLAVERLKLHENNHFAVLFLDLDRFKVINDSLGHYFGDKVLDAVGSKISRCVRSNDLVGRLGGDEFIVLLEGVFGLVDAEIVSRRIQQALQTPTDLSGHKIVTSASIGIVMSDDRYSSAEDILRDADIAMYHAKRLGKACHAVFNPLMRTRAITRMGLENDLRLVLEDDYRLDEEMRLLFQPIVSLTSGRIAGFEALLRWVHPKRGVIPPNDFIPIAEETGLIHKVGLWVLRKACQQVSEWQSWFGASPDLLPISINVNISGKQFSRPDLVELIQQVIQEYEIEPSSLNLEITESWLMENEQSFHEKLQRIKNLGVNLQIDDFGNGYSSYRYLQSFPVTSLKIDSAFIGRLGLDDNNSEIVRSIVGLARALGMSVIAEGVETETQYQILKEFDCPFVQGYYISEPISSQRAGELLVENWTVTPHLYRA